MYVSLQSIRSFHYFLSLDPPKKSMRNGGEVSLSPCSRLEKLRYGMLNDLLKVTHCAGSLGQSRQLAWHLLLRFLMLCCPRGFFEAQSCKQPNSRISCFSHNHAKGMKGTKSQQHDSGFLGLVCHRISNRDQQVRMCMCSGSGYISPPNFHHSSLKSF